MLNTPRTSWIQCLLTVLMQASLQIDLQKEYLWIPAGTQLDSFLHRIMPGYPCRLSKMEIWLLLKPGAMRTF
jgi:hypothetical protein